MPNKPRCIYNHMVKVRTIAMGEGKPMLYDGPRQVECEGFMHCNTCGWNPAVEEERKRMPLEGRKGYVGLDGKVKDEDNDYRGIFLPHENIYKK